MYQFDPFALFFADHQQTDIQLELVGGSSLGDSANSSGGVTDVVAFALAMLVDDISDVHFPKFEYAAVVEWHSIVPPYHETPNGAAMYYGGTEVGTEPWSNTNQFNHRESDQLVGIYSEFQEDSQQLSAEKENIVATSGENELRVGYEELEKKEKELITRLEAVKKEKAEIDKQIKDIEHLSE